MQAQSTSFEKRASSIVAKSKYLFVTLAIIVSCALALILFEITPRYITIPVSPPEDSFGANWWTTTKSTITFESTPPIRLFVWRRDTILSYENTDDIPSWDSIKIYFDENFSKYGWEEGDSSMLCNSYLPESAFLNPGENGFIPYHKTDTKTNRDETTDEVICLAIWNDDGYPNVYRIVMLTVKSSFFTHLLTVFEL